MGASPPCSWPRSFLTSGGGCDSSCSRTWSQPSTSPETKATTLPLSPNTLVWANMHFFDFGVMEMVLTAVSSGRGSARPLPWAPLSMLFRTSCLTFSNSACRRKARSSSRSALDRAEALSFLLSFFSFCSFFFEDFLPLCFWQEDDVEEEDEELDDLALFFLSFFHPFLAPGWSDSTRTTNSFGSPRPPQ